MELRGRFQSVYGRAAVVGIIMLLMLWPLAQVQSLVLEREGLQIQAREGIAAIHGGAQVIGGPMLRVPTEVLIEEWDAGQKIKVARWADGSPRWLLPATLRITTGHRVRTERRGIYELAVYTLPDLEIRGEFPSAALAGLGLDPSRERAAWARATVVVPFGSLASLQAVRTSELGSQRLVFGSGAFQDQPALAAPLDLTALVSAGAISFHFAFVARGSGALRFLPMAGATQVKVRSEWPHPSFDGPFPADHSVPGPQGFTASWQVLEINRELPRRWTGGEVSGKALFASAFGFSMLTPVDVYSLSYRATRYGVLFIAVTFLVFFAWEQLTRGLQLHGMHYLLVGLALSVFFLLLLALGEHLPFAIAYGAAAAALILLITVYVAGVADALMPALGIGAGLGALYGCLFLILLSEDYALLLGSLLVFSVLAATMLATRHLQWGSAEARDQ